MSGAENPQIDSIEKRYASLTPEQRAQWLVNQAAVVRSLEERTMTTEQEANDARTKLARFIAIQTAPEVWGLLSGDQADEVVNCQPDGEGYFGLDAEEGRELSLQWAVRTGVEPPHTN